MRISPVADERLPTSTMAACRKRAGGEEQFRQDVERIIRHDIKSPLFGIYGLAQVAMTRKTRWTLRRSFLRSFGAYGRWFGFSTPQSRSGKWKPKSTVLEAMHWTCQGFYAQRKA